ncbi:hypothetical protein [Maliponia aquimaris]|nr:hypothetical protein [Maliponia aquimaris]
MKNAPPRATPPRSHAKALARPRPTAAAALLLASVLSLPFAALALTQAVF